MKVIVVGKGNSRERKRLVHCLYDGRVFKKPREYH